MASPSAAEGLGHHDEAVDADDPAASDGLEVARAAVCGDDHVVGANLALPGAHHRAALAAERDGRRILVDAGPKPRRGTGEPERETVGVEMAAAAVADRAGIKLRAERLGRLGAIQKGHEVVPITARQSLHERGGLVQQSGLVEGLDHAGPEVAGNGEADDQAADQRLRLLRHVPEQLGALKAEAPLQPELVLPLAGMDLAAAAARRAVGDPAGFQQHHIRTGIGEVDRRGQAGEAAADNADIGLARSFEAARTPARRKPQADRRTAAARGPCSAGRFRRSAADIRAPRR